MFMFFLYVIERWTASATSYTLLLMPLVTAVAAALALSEPITVALVAGGTLVVAGVYVGAFAPSLSTMLPGLRRRAEPATGLAIEPATPGPPTLERPGCP
jgi:drug/metabolite transporter (DMT)-like permease